MMTIHHLNCATMNPIATPPVVAHVLLVERPAGLLLVDTGFGTADLANPKRLGQPFRALMRPTLDPAETALAQVMKPGYSAQDVTDIVLTHLDLDHAGGLSDFPQARVHVYDPLRAFQRLVAFDNAARVDNQSRLRELRASAPEVSVFSAHDAEEFAALV